MIMAGGGFNFSYYLGMYAAAVDTGHKPDLLLATCGGAIAAAVVQSLPTDAERRDWVSSPAMYQFLCGLRSTPKAAIGRSLVQAIARRLRSSQAGTIPDLFNDYFFDIPAQLPLPPPALDPDVALAIVGGKILFAPEEVGQRRAGRKLFAETVFCNARTAALLAGAQSPLADPAYGEHAIDSPVRIDTSMALASAVRISMSDMFYFRCFSAAGEHYMGGVIDLFPIELARRAADSIALELKSPFGLASAIPALRAVLGIDGNQRLRAVHAQHADVWIDTSDVALALKGMGATKALSWRENRIRLVMPATHAAYVAQVEAQWQFGYRRAREAYGHGVPNYKAHIRNASKHNFPL